MPTYEVTSPDGQVFEVTAPEGASEQDVLAYAQANFKPKAKPAPKPAESSPLGSADDWKRAAGLTARNLVEGAAVIPGMITDPLVATSNAILGRQDYDARSSVGLTLDKLGFPRPQNDAERFTSAVNEGVAGGGGVVALGRRAMAAASPVVRAVGQTLSAGPGQQIAGAGLGAGAGEAVRQGGGGQGAQVAAGLAGGLAPTALVSIGAMGIRGLLRGGEAGRAGMEQSINDFRSVGATPSVGQATGNRRTQGLESLLSASPTSSGVLARAAESQADDIGTGLQKRAEALYRNASGERAGRAIDKGIDAFSVKFKGTQEKLYDNLDNFIPQDARVDVSNTMNTLGNLNASIPGAPSVSKLFQNSRVKGIGQALEQDIAIPTKETISLEDALTNLDRVYASRSSAMQDAGRFAATRNAQSNLGDNFYPVQGQPRFPGRYSLHPERAAEAGAAADDAASIATGRLSQAQLIEQTLDDLRAAAAQTQGRLPYEAIKKLRTLVGQELQDAGLMSDFPRSKFNALYKALSQDLGAAARAAGPKAYQTFQRANTYTRVGMARMEQVASVVDKNGGSEKIFQATMAGTRDGGTTLRAVMQSLPKDGQRAVTAAVIKRMGLAVDNQQNAEGAVFSAQTFLTNWNKVSPEARRALFDRHGSRFSANMDKIARVAERIRTGSKVYANPSGTANRAAALTYAGTLGAAVLTGQVGTAGMLAGAGATANVGARFMTNPRFVEWLARSTELPKGALVQQALILKGIAMREQDEEMAAYANSLIQDAPKSPSQPNNAGN